jgi:hypothetical protein
MNRSFFTHSTIAIFLNLFFIGKTCAMDSSDDSPRFQAFVLENKGASVVHDVAIKYGQFVVPTEGSSRRTIPPNRIATSHESAAVPVPNSASVHWVSSDGQAHDATVPVRALIENWKTFQGFKFSFSDDHLAVSRLDQTGEAANFTPLGFTLVFQQ